MAEAPGSKLKEAVEIINSAYPEEVGDAPNWRWQFLNKREQFLCLCVCMCLHQLSVLGRIESQCCQKVKFLYWRNLARIQWQ
jgi:hypothetical protein